VTKPRRFPPPWSIQEADARFMSGTALAGGAAIPLKRLPVGTQVVRSAAWRTDSQRA
jgi:hypothetical protein